MDKLGFPPSSFSRASGEVSSKEKWQGGCSTGETCNNLHANSKESVDHEKKNDVTKFEVVEYGPAGSMCAFFQVGKSGKLIFSCVPRTTVGNGDSHSPPPQPDDDDSTRPMMRSFGSHTTMKFSITALLSIWLTQEDGKPVRFISDTTSTALSIWRHQRDPDLRYVVVEGSYEHVTKACSWLMLCITLNSVYSVYPFAVTVYTGIPCLMEQSQEGCPSRNLCNFSHSDSDERLQKQLLTSQVKVVSYEGNDKTAALNVGKEEKLIFSCAPTHLPDSPSTTTAAGSSTHECHATMKIAITALWGDFILGNEGAAAREISALTGTILSVWKHKLDSGLRYVVLDGLYENVIIASSLMYQTLVNSDLINPAEESSCSSQA